MENPVAFIVLKPGINVADVDTKELNPVVMMLDFQFGVKTDEELIDLIPQIDAKLKGLAKWIEAAKGVLKSRLKAPENVGDVSITRAHTFEAVYSKRQRISLNTELVKQEMGEEWYAEHCMTTEYEELRFKSLPTAGE